MSWVSESSGSFSISPINVMYLFFEIILVFWQCIVLEQHLIQSPEDLMSIIAKLGWVVTVAGSFLLLTAM